MFCEQKRSLKVYLWCRVTDVPAEIRAEGESVAPIYRCPLNASHTECRWVLQCPDVS